MHGDADADDADDADALNFCFSVLTLAFCPLVCLRLNLIPNFYPRLLFLSAPLPPGQSHKGE